MVLSGPDMHGWRNPVNWYTAFLKLLFITKYCSIPHYSLTRPAVRFNWPFIHGKFQLKYCKAVNVHDLGQGTGRFDTRVLIRHSYSNVWLSGLQYYMHRLVSNGSETHTSVFHDDGEPVRWTAVVRFCVFSRDFLPRGSGIVTRRPLVLQLITANTGDAAGPRVTQINMFNMHVCENLCVTLQSGRSSCTAKGRSSLISMRSVRRLRPRRTASPGRIRAFPPFPSTWGSFPHMVLEQNTAETKPHCVCLT